MRSCQTTSFLVNPIGTLCYRGAFLRAPLLFLAVMAFASMSSGQPFTDDCRSVRQIVESATLTLKHDLTTPYLKKWIEFADLPDLFDSISKGVAHRPHEEAVALLRSSSQAEGLNLEPYAWLERALMASAVAEREIAIDSYRKSLETGPLDDQPFVHAFLARETLLAGDLAGATIEYELAVLLAKVTGDRNKVFRARHLYAGDLYDSWQVERAAAIVLAMQDSPLPLERAWALSQRALYDWGRGDKDAALTAAGQLRLVLPSASPLPDLGWQKRRHKGVVKIMDDFEGIIRGDPVSTMAVDEESFEYEFMKKNFGVLERLKPWVEKYPLEDYTTWADPKLREVAVWCHLNYSIYLGMNGRPEDAKTGFRKIIELIPFTEHPGRVTAAWCRMGQVLLDQKDYASAKEALETGLKLDASRAPSSPNLPKGLDQPRIQGGLVQPMEREWFVGSYKEVVRQLEKVKAGEEK